MAPTTPGVPRLSTQTEVSDEIAALAKAYDAAGVVERSPRLDYPPYRSSVLRHPTEDPRHADPEGIESGGAGLRPLRRAPAGGGPHHPGQRRAHR
ncbi:hypothetical protein [Nocardioides convexus]|uniref:hypothetical protein n=1 Tax=Nocardioides convexus TaxID=2712224 RepID=UPI0024185E47|nr:hypothetical protein [Nocardioides convexus]